jgi:PEP-CTERM/exosortase A-associated glycosyltransferase
MSLRVLHVLDHSIPMQSGYAFRTLGIVRGQRALGWETFHVTSPKHTAAGPMEEDVDGLHFYRTGPIAAGAIPVLRELKLMKATERRLDEVVRRVKPHVLHAHSPVLNAIPAIRVGRRHGIPVVYEVRAFWEDAAVDHGTSREWGLRYRATRAVETWACRNVQHITCICEGLRADIVGRGIAPERVTVIPNAVDAGEFTFGVPRQEALAARYGLQDCTVLGFIGSFYAYEGLDVLLDALPRILEVRPDVRALLVGGGPQEETLKVQAGQLGLQDKVIFTGRVPHGEVQDYYSLVDVFAFPRHSMRLTELVTPLKPLEAMAMGKVVVASDVGGHRELITNGETGFLFAPGSPAALADSVLQLLAARQSWPSLRASGRRFVESERSWSRSVQRYSNVYPQLAHA